MLQFPHTFWPAGYIPRGLFLDDASRYEVRRHVEDGDDVLLAATPPGTTEQLVTGEDNSDERMYVRVFNRCNLADTDPVTPKLRRVAFDDDGALILPAPPPPIALSLVPRAGGEVVAQWITQKLNNFAAQASFNLYVAVGAAAFDFDTPTLTANPGGRPTTKSLGNFLTGDVVRCVVRAVSAAGVVEQNSVEASATADATAPKRVIGLTLEVTPG